MTKKEKESVMGLAKTTIGVGVATTAGHGILGSMSGVPGMPAAAAPALKSASAGLNLVGVGQLAKVGMAIPKMMTDVSTKTKTKSKQVNKILGL